jgi:hypothetical protein
MRKVLLWIGIIFVAMLVITFVAGLIAHEPLPEGEPGPAADSLARRMEAAVNKEAWDSTVLVQWTFAGMHHFLWDKERDFCRVRWDDKEVLLDLNTITGKARQDGQALEGEAAKELVQQAWSYFANDSFWLNACVKAFDPGTERRLVRLPGGDEGLLVTYTKGGVTPGDSYLWILDEDGLPQRWKMWVSILPVGGVSATWEDWTTLDSGAKIATTHQNAMFTLKITDLRGARSKEAFGLSKDPFQHLSGF